MTRFVIVDGNSIGFAAQSSTRLTVGDQEVQAVFGFVKTIRGIKAAHPDATIMVLWDGESWRKRELTSYKANRDDNPKMRVMRDAYKSQRPFIAKALRTLGIAQVSALNLEADDLAGIFVKRISANGGEALLLTGDKDWLQLVRRGVTWFDPVREKKVTLGTFSDFTGYANSDRFVEAKALQGDISDNVPGVGGIGEKRALDLINEFGSVSAFLDTPSGELPTKLPKALREFHDSEEKRRAFARNLYLMDLRRDDLPKPEGLRYVPGSLDTAAFADLCGELAFRSILADIPKFVAPFERRK